MIRIITDSAADLTEQDARRVDAIVPLNVTFEDDSSILDDGKAMSKDEYYARVARDTKLPRTSQPSPEAFMEVFNAAREAGDEVICITIASKLSGTWQCANLAAADVGVDGYIIDSDTATAGEALLVREALRLRGEGCTAVQIAARLEELKSRVCVLAVVDSLKHLHKGGRLPAAVAIVGGALGIKPVLTLRDGEIKMIDKARGRPGAMASMFKKIEEAGGVDESYGYAVLYSDDKPAAGPVEQYMQDTLHLAGGFTAQMGATIGTHVGPGTTGLAFVTKA